MNKLLKYLLPIVALAAALFVSQGLFLSKPKVVRQAPEIKIPLVSVAEVNAESIRIPVQSRGTVAPGTEIQLVSEVSGQVIELSKNFVNGGFFRKGETLVKVDPIEYEVNIKRAEASRAQAYQAMQQADAERKARARVRNDNKSSLASYDIQYRQAKAQYDATVAELEAAKLQKARTVIKAPFDGRVRMATLNQGQFVRPGAQMGSIYSVDVAEIRLPLSDRQIGLVDLPSPFREGDEVYPSIVISEEFAGKKYTWDGKLIRAEGGLDERNRLLYVVAQIDDPYGVDPDQPGRPELVSGAFVEAEIAGRSFEEVFVVPRKALRNGSELWVVDRGNKLRKKEVSVLHKSKNHVFLSGGLQNGDRVVLNQLDIAVTGMEVRTEVQSFELPREARTKSDLFDQPNSNSTTTPGKPDSAPQASTSTKSTSTTPKSQLPEVSRTREIQPTVAAKEPKSEPKSEPKPKPEPKPEVALKPETSPKPEKLSSPVSATASSENATTSGVNISVVASPSTLKEMAQ